MRRANDVPCGWQIPLDGQALHNRRNRHRTLGRDAKVLEGRLEVVVHTTRAPGLPRRCRHPLGERRQMSQSKHIGRCKLPRSHYDGLRGGRDDLDEVRHDSVDGGQLH